MTYKYVSRLQARRIFERAFGSGGAIYTTHMREQMAARDIDTNDLLCVKDTGIIEREPDRSVRGVWSYTIKGEDAEGKALAVAFLILEENKVLLKSCWRCRT